MVHFILEGISYVTMREIKARCIFLMSGLMVLFALFFNGLASTTAG